jgi:NitT/TauT family transport system permease protein
MRFAKNTYTKAEAVTWPVPNYWDAIALVLVFAVIFLVGFGTKAMLGQYHPGMTLAISLSPKALPYYALRTVIRILIALAFSLLFTFVIGTWAAKSKQAERVIIPIIDILQSVPVLGFLSFTIVAFVVLFRGSLLGPECAAIFTIFVAQVWNMILSFYQSLRTVPEDLKEAALMFQLSPWQRFWRLEVPFAMPGLLWNAMLSMSGSWVFLVASEAITVAGHNITLPGIGSYIYVASQQQNKTAILYAIVAMLIVIAIYDQLLFRPLVAWSAKFKAEQTSGGVESESWVLDLFQNTRFFRAIGSSLSYVGELFVNNPWLNWKMQKKYGPSNLLVRKAFLLIWNVVLLLIIAIAAYVLIRFIFSEVTWQEGTHALYLGMLTAIRVLVLILVSSLIWIPIGVWIGLNPRATQIVQPIAQFLAAFPANLLFPIAATVIVYYHLNPSIWLSPLMILGTQWYILFNVVAGTTAIPKNLIQAVNTLNISGWLWWKRLILPAIFPYYITGAITAAGGAWNISILAEAVQWGNTYLWATGLGSYITRVANLGDFPRLALGITVMSLYVVVINRSLWRPLYNLAVERFQIR